MTNLIGLWHLNESTTGTAPGAKDFADQSGNGNNVVKTGTITLNAAGRFNKGINSNNSGGYIDLTGVNTLISNTGNFTFAAWFNVTSFTNGCAGSGTYLTDRAVSGGGNPLAGICIRSNAYNMEVRCDSGSGLAQILGGTVITGQWQHVAIQRDRANNLYRIFVDGVQTGTGADSGCATTLDPFRFGRHATNTSGGLNGSGDEIAVWSRALSAAEILQLYRRGSNRIKFQIKNCTASDCSDNPTWKGPDNTSGTFFTEINNNTTPITGLGTVQTGSPTMTISNFTGVGPYNNRYFQYQIIFETDNTAYSPDIISTTLQH